MPLDGMGGKEQGRCAAHPNNLARGPTTRTSLTCEIRPDRGGNGGAFVFHGVNEVNWVDARLWLRFRLDLGPGRQPAGELSSMTRRRILKAVVGRRPQ
jgi:hypothetical protein